MCCGSLRGHVRDSFVTRNLFRLTFLLGGMFVFLSLAPVYADAAGLTATTIGDVENVTVMEVGGDYNALKTDGTPNNEARAAVTQEFYRTHSDDYDFLVIFTNFDFQMPVLGAKAFYTNVKNDVQGIGVDLHDYSSLYGSVSGQLQGLVDMWNIENLAHDPVETDFDQTLLTLTHEFMHRWGVQVQFDDGSGTPSKALLGPDGKHWSFLFDSGGSTLYGNNWRDNGDGTFTSIQTEQGSTETPLGRIFSPLELYLLGFVDKAQVPPMLLIESPTIDPGRMPEVGVTIPGTARTVTIDDIIAVEGERVPTAADAPKNFKIGFIYLAVPGTTDPAHLKGIENIRAEFIKRFSILTNGEGLLEVKPTSKDSGLPSNPGVTPPTVDPRTVAANVNDGVSWLMANQQAGGFWQDNPETVDLATAAGVQSLSKFPVAAQSVQSAAAWLAAGQSANTDYLARKIEALAAGGQDVSLLVADLKALQNSDGGWGSASGYLSNPVDTALALGALHAAGETSGFAITNAVTFLQSAQNSDGGWSVGSGPSMVQPTATVLGAFNGLRDGFVLDAEITIGMNWLLSKQNADGGFGNSPSTVYDTALAVSTLKDIGAPFDPVNGGINYLLAAQGKNGSWNASAFQTALAVEALWKGQVAVDLAVDATDVSFTPANVTEYPGQVQVNATVRNLGSTSVSQAIVGLYRDFVSPENLVSQKTVSFSGGGSAAVAFTADILEPFDQVFVVAIDPSNLVPEISTQNNIATKTLPVDFSAPAVGFELASSNVLESGAAKSIRVVLDYAWDQSLSVDYLLNAFGTAVQPADFSLAPGMLTFAPGETAKNIDLSIVDDPLAEGPETVILDLANPSAGTLGIARHTLTIQDDDTPPTISFETTTGAGWESVASLVVGVSLNFAWSEPVSVELAPGAGGTALAGSDYLGAAGTLTFAPGETYKSISLAIADDADIEADETFVVTLQNPVNGSLGEAAFTYTIKDNDTPPELTISPVNATGDESVPQAQFNLGLNHSWNGPVSVTFSVDPASTAAPGEDFVLSSSTVTFAPGETAKAFVVDIVDDYLVEADEEFRLNLVNPVDAVLLQNQVAYTIVNNDVPPSVTISAPADGFLTSDSTPVIGYQVSHGTVTVKVDGSPVATTSGQPLPPLADGAHTLRVEAADSVGRTGFAEVSFSIDATPPVITIVSPVSGATPDINPQLYYQINEGSATVTLDGEVVNVNSGDFLGPLEDGSHALRIDAVDALGNAGFSELSFTVRTSAAPPSPMVESPYELVPFKTLTRVESRGDRFTDVHPDGNGNYYSIISRGSLGSYKIQISKYDTSMNLVWQILVDSPYDDEVRDFHVSDCGTIYIAGLTKSRGCFDGSGNCVEDYYHNPILVKVADLGTAGEIQWIKQWGGDYKDMIYGMAVDEFENIFIAGFHEENWSHIDQTYYTYARFDSQGTQLRDTHRKSESYCADVALGGNLYCGVKKYDYDGNFLGTILDPQAASNFGVGPDGFLYSIKGDRIYKYNISGEIVWRSEEISVQPHPGVNYGTSGPFVSLSNYSFDKNGNMYCIGRTDGDLFGYQYAGGGADAFLLKYDPYGRIVWIRQFGSSYNDKLSKIYINDNDELFFVNYRIVENEMFWSYYDYDFYKISGSELSVPYEASTKFYFNSSSGCRQSSTSKGPVTTTLGLSPGECAGPDSVKMRFNGGPQDMLLAYKPGGYSQSALIEGQLSGNILSFLSDSSGVASVDLVEVDPASGTVIKSLGSVSQDFEAGKFGYVEDLSSFRGVIPAGNTFGIKIALTADSRGINEIQYGQGSSCPKGGRQWVTVREKAVETVLPASTIVSPVQDQSLGGDYYLIEGTSNDNGGSGIKRVNVSLDGGITWGTAFDTSADGSWSSWSYPWTGIGDGTYTILSQAVDRDGNVEVSGPQVRVTVESLVERLSIDPIQTLINVYDITLTGSKGEGTTLSVQGPPGSIVGPITDTGTQWQCRVSGLYRGENQIEVNSKDGFGNFAYRTVVITVDDVAPSLIIDTYESVTEDSTTTVRGQCEAGSIIQATLNDGETLSGGWGDFNHTSWYVHIYSLPLGENTIKVTATDSAGNVSEETVITQYIPPPSMEISLSPSQIDSNFIGEVELRIEKVPSPGQYVFLEQYFDADGDGVVGPLDSLVRAIRLQDGVVPFVENISGDDDALANQVIVSRLNYLFPLDYYHTPGKYIFQVGADMVSGPGVATLDVVENPTGQAVSGTVFAAGLPVSGALVRALDKWDREVAFAFADQGGNYILNIENPGQYRILPSAQGYYAELASQPTVDLGAGQYLSGINSSLSTGTHKVFFRSSSWSTPMVGYVAEASSADIYAMSVFDRTGYYELKVPTGEFTFQLRAGFGGHPSEIGRLRYQDSSVRSVNGDIEGALGVSSGSYRLCGTASTPSGVPVVGVPLLAVEVGDGHTTEYFKSSDSNGHYCMVVRSSWMKKDLFIDPEAGQMLGFVGSHYKDLSSPEGTFDLTVYPIDSWVEGRLTDNFGNPLPGVAYRITRQDGAVEVSGKTALDGYYRRGLFGGDWSVEFLLDPSQYNSIGSENITLVDGQTLTHDVVAIPSQVYVNIDPVVTPTNDDTQVLSGTMSEGAIVAIVAETSVFVGTVSYPTSTTWECQLANLADGVNNFSVSAQDPSGNSASQAVSITYNAPVPNSIVVQKAEYWNQKQTLTVIATSDWLGSANLWVEGFGPMTWDRKRSQWKFEMALSSAPEVVTVYGTEGSKTVSVSIR